MGTSDDQAPVDVGQLSGSGFAELDDVQAAAAQSGHPWWTLSQLPDESAVELDVRAAPSARGHQHDIDGIFAMLRAHVSTGGHAAVVAPGTGTAHRVVERLAESDSPAAMLESGAAPEARAGRGAQRPAARRPDSSGRRPGDHHRDRPDRKPGHVR